METAEQEQKNDRRAKYEKLREKVKLAAQESQNKTRENFGLWLNSAKPFNVSFRLSSAKKKISDDLLRELLPDGKKIYKWDQKSLDFEILCANLLHRHWTGPVVVPMDRNQWGKSRYSECSYFILEAVRLLGEREYVGMETGAEIIKRRSRIWPERKLLERFKPLVRQDVYEDFLELVNIRDEDGRLLDYKDNKESNRVREILRRANRVHRENEIVLIEGGRAVNVETDLHAVYRDTGFTLHGRLYTGRGGYQALSEDERLKIRINREKVVELDFSGMAPRLLYSLEGLEVEGDVYDLGLDDELRPILKKLTLAVLYAGDEKTAIAATNETLHENHDWYELMNERGLKVKADLLPTFYQKHRRIRHHFYSPDLALRLMNLDAKIALDVVEIFTRQEKPCLPIHDSFLVQEKYRDELLDTMKKSYSKYTGGFQCPIK